jgi:antitoxin component HigA of HigAB toxin-antitoxin module
LKVIKNEEEYLEALKSMEAVFDATERPSADYAEALTLLIEKYEESLHSFPISPTGPPEPLKKHRAI